MSAAARSDAVRAVPPYRLGDIHLSHEEISARVGELGREIAADYARRDLLLLVVLKGAVVFATDLSRAVGAPHSLDFVSLAGYSGSPDKPAAARLLKDLDAPIAGRDVLVVENVVDTGLTLNYLLKTLALRDPASLAVCTLLDRPNRRLVEDLPIRYVGFPAPDEFFVGYGFQLEGRYCALPELRLLLRD